VFEDRAGMNRLHRRAPRVDHVGKIDTAFIQVFARIVICSSR
jgi:hypothetical protein